MLQVVTRLIKPDVLVEIEVIAASHQAWHGLGLCGCCKHLVLDVELQQNRRMIRRAADRLRIDPAKPKIGQIQFLNKDVDHPNGIVLADPIFQAFRKQRALPRPTRIGMSRS